jgi:hypothetical protein
LAVMTISPGNHRGVGDPEPAGYLVEADQLGFPIAHG